jgi:hydrogenase nickel incorporation protein HypA/HybF
MHEISLVQNLIQQLKELAAANNASRIITVTMEIGPLAGVVVDSFRFGFDILSADDDLIKGAVLIVQTPEVSYRCSGCGAAMVTASARPEKCLQCGDTLLVAAGGDDLILRQIEME